VSCGDELLNNAAREFCSYDFYAFAIGGCLSSKLGNSYCAHGCVRIFFFFLKRRLRQDKGVGSPEPKHGLHAGDDHLLTCHRSS
jgi:hypothetical protein